MSENPGRDPAPFVLLHGGRHGGWCWSRVARSLRGAGHEVHTPTLTGLGERSHLLTPQVGLETHVTDLANLFHYEDLRDVVLVAHSYGGMVATGALEIVADRVAHLVLLDAHMPRTGESVFDLNGPDRAGAMVELADRQGGGWFIPPTGATRYGVTDPRDVAWVEDRLTSQPLRTYQDRTVVAEAMWKHPGTFVECVPSSLEPHLLARARERSRSDPTFGYRVLAATHSAMVTDPEAVTGLLLEIAAQTV